MFRPRYYIRGQSGKALEVRASVVVVSIFFGGLHLKIADLTDTGWFEAKRQKTVPWSKSTPFFESAREILHTSSMSPYEGLT